ncbi:MAG TPA: hypothetical protein VI698_01310, partial [Nitrososphaerales archaeon]|nr:hypothetical protein [Nitrososphaerales archaeon]
GDMAKPASIGDRLATVRVDMRPAFLLAEAPQDATIEMRLFDTKTDITIQHVTFYVTLKKGDKVLMSDWFHAHDGDLFIKIRPAKQQNVLLNAPQDPILNGYIGSRDQPVLATGPIFLEGGLYHFVIEIFSIDFDQTILDPPIKYDTYISIGETSTYPVTNGGEHQISVRTYYDKTEEFSYDNENGFVKFSMPFNWDKQYLAQVPLVHQEVVIPKSFTELVADKYTGVVNGVRLPDSAVMVDPSDPNQLIVHYMIPNQPLLQLADKVASNGESSKAEFTLAPGVVDIGTPLGGADGSGQMMQMSSRGSFHGTLSVSPTSIDPGKTTSFTFSFMDRSMSNTIRDVTYDFVLVKDGQEITKRQGKTLAGAASEQFTFSESHAGSITLRLENINNTGESMEFPFIVTPEFPISLVVLLMAVTFGAVVLAGRYNIVKYRI